jgi:hypothetical protein
MPKPSRKKKINNYCKFEILYDPFKLHKGLLPELNPSEYESFPTVN